MLRLCKSEKGKITAGLGLLLISSSITISIPFFIGKIIDLLPTESKNRHMQIPKAVASRVPESLNGYFDRICQKANFPLYALSAAIGCTSAATFFRVYLLRIVGERLICQLRQTLFATLIKRKTSFFDTTKTGDIVSRLSTDTHIVGKVLTSQLPDGLRASLQIVTGICFTLHESRLLGCLIMCVIPPLSLFVGLYGKYVKKLSTQTLDALSVSAGFAKERIDNIKTIKAFCAEQKEALNYFQKTNTVLSIAYKESLASAFFAAGIIVAAFMPLIGIVWIGGTMIVRGMLTVGQLSSFLLYTIYIGSSIARFGTFYSEVSRGMGAGVRVFAMLDGKGMNEGALFKQTYPPEFFVRNSALPLHSEQRVRCMCTHDASDCALPAGDIEIKNLAFAYSAHQPPVFTDLNLTIKQGKSTAIVGESGIGKSTLIHLLLRFYDADQGCICIGGRDIKHMPVDCVRKAISVVSQDIVLFDGSVRDNIAYSEPLGSDGDNTFDKVRRAAVMANASRFVESFPDKYMHAVGERGNRLSGGQKQRIAIARAVMKNSSVLIFDEATSSLDAESEFLVQDAITNMLKDKTLITIAHRLSTIRSADYIAVLDGQRVAEYGTYKELKNIKHGRFVQLLESQKLK